MHLRSMDQLLAGFPRVPGAYFIFLQAVRLLTLNQTYSDLENRKERNRLRAMIFGQPLVETQALKLSQVVAIDCEMVGVGPPIGHKTRNGKRDPIRRSALARVSIVDFHGHVVLDAYIKPREKVTDFRTSVSGIRPSDLVGENAIPFENARALVSKVLNGRIVVGHDIRNDLRVRASPATASASKLD